MSDLVQIEYHPLCTFYGDEGCIEQTGEYVCACGASTAWHKITPVEVVVSMTRNIDYEAIVGYMKRHHLKINTQTAIGLVNAALGIEGGDDE